jgi:membrane protease YdiL (CAAX protease family)
MHAARLVLRGKLWRDSRARLMGERMTGLDASRTDALARRRVLRELIAFFALAFAISWGLGAAVIFFRPQFERLVGPLGPLISSWPYYVAVCAPTISAILVSAAFGGLAGVAALFRGLIRPVRLRWVIVALTAFPAGLLVWGLVARGLSGNAASHGVDIRAILIGAPLLLFSGSIFIDPGPWGEETGWRGFALPRLLTRFSPLTAAIILGAIWGFWHTPAFFLSGLSQSGYDYVGFVAGSIGETILMTWIYVNANRNYLVGGYLVHAMNNLMATSHVFSDTRIQAAVYLTIGALVFAACGSGLKGWRFGRSTLAGD